MTRSGRMIVPAFAFPRGRLVEKRLIDVGLNERELHARLVAQAADVLRRSGRRHRLELDIRRRRDVGSRGRAR